VTSRGGALLAQANARRRGAHGVARCALRDRHESPHGEVVRLVDEARRPLEHPAGAVVALRDRSVRSRALAPERLAHGPLALGLLVSACGALEGACAACGRVVGLGRVGTTVAHVETCLFEAGEGRMPWRREPPRRSTGPRALSKRQMRRRPPRDLPGGLPRLMRRGSRSGSKPAKAAARSCRAQRRGPGGAWLGEERHRCSRLDGSEEPQLQQVAQVSPTATMLIERRKKCRFSS